MSYFRTLVVNDVDSSCLLCYVIDPMQNVRIQNSLTNLVRDNKFFAIFVSKNEVSEAKLKTNKRII